MKKIENKYKYQINTLLSSSNLSCALKSKILIVLLSKNT